MINVEFKLKPNFGKLLVYDLLQIKPSYLSQKPTQENNNLNNYDTTLLQYLFSLLMFKESRLQACQLIESILLHMPMLNLNRINNIRYILENIDDDGLSCICKIFAVTLSNLDLHDKKYLVNGQRRIQQQQQQQQLNNYYHTQANLMSNASAPGTSSSFTNQTETNIQQNRLATSMQPATLSVRDQNQELLLNIPSFYFV